MREFIEIDERRKAIEHWLVKSCGIEAFFLQPIIGDASLRRYFRLYAHGQSLIVMDAPPPENTRSFIVIAKALRKLGLYTPEIIQANIEHGFLLITDFGDATFLKTLNVNNAEVLYQRALKALAVLQSCPNENQAIPVFNAEFMFKEWSWFKEWVLYKWLNLSLSHEVEKNLDACYAHIVKSVVKQPQVFMHRDFHSANLMVLPHGEVGILDFQDAFIGPVTYDVVSLLRDCYIDWPQENVRQWALYYASLLRDKEILIEVDDQTFLRWFDVMGMQRQLKALLTFARKYVRDHDTRYLAYVPRTLSYLLYVMQSYPEYKELYNYLQKEIQPAIARKLN